MMKAAVYTEYGTPDVLQLREIPRPSPKANEILIKVQASSLGYGDLLARNFSNSRQEFNMPSLFWLPARVVFGYKRPKKQVLGGEFAGVVEAVGQDVTRFKVGDAVFGYSGANFGANAEYMSFPQDGIVALKPATMSFEEAVTIPYGALTALNLLRKVNIQAGQKVLIHGASGAIGSMAVQLAKDSGAEVTGVCGTKRLDFVRSLGADMVIDYTQEDFTQNGQVYDVILDVLGKRSFVECRDSLTPQGIYLMASFKTRRIFRMLGTAFGGGKKAVCALASYTLEDFLLVRELVEAGKIRSSVDKVFPLAETADAHRYAEAGSRQGFVVIGVG